MNISSVIIPAAGYGTRFLPYTKTIPKEMLPLLNTPAIHTIIDEGIDSNIKNIVLVTNKEKEALNKYFSSAPLLEHFLERQHKSNLLSTVEHILNSITLSFVEQAEQKGLGHAILMARTAIKDSYFGIMLPDDIIHHHTPALAQLIAIAQKENATIIAVQEVPRELVSSYGIIAIKRKINSRLYEVDTLIEKPSTKQAPSNLAIIGRYILSNKIFDALEHIEPSANGEIQLTDGIAHILKEQNERVLAYKIEGRRYDIGTPLGWLKATFDIALQHPEYSEEIKQLFISHLGQIQN